MAVGGIVADHLHQLDPAGAGQPELAQHQVDAVAVKLGKAVLGVAGGDDHHAELAQAVGDDPQIDAVRLDHEQARYVGKVVQVPHGGEGKREWLTRR